MSNRKECTMIQWVRVWTEGHHKQQCDEHAHGVMNRSLFNLEFQPLAPSPPPLPCHPASPQTPAETNTTAPSVRVTVYFHFLLFLLPFFRKKERFARGWQDKCCSAELWGPQHQQELLWWRTHCDECVCGCEYSHRRGDGS